MMSQVSVTGFQFISPGVIATRNFSHQIFICDSASVLMLTSIPSQKTYAKNFTSTVIAGTPKGFTSQLIIFVFLILLYVIASGFVDGRGTQARFNVYLKGMVLMSNQTTLFISDNLNDAIRRVDVTGATSEITTTFVNIDGPWGIALSKNESYLYAVASNSKVVYRLSLNAAKLFNVTVTDSMIIAGSKYSVSGEVTSMNSNIKLILCSLCRRKCSESSILCA